MAYAMEIVSGFWAGLIAGMITVLVIALLRLGRREKRRLRFPPGEDDARN